MTPAWPHGDPRDVVRSIVADPRFVATPVPAPVGRWWLDDVRDSVERLLRAILHGLDHALGARNPLDTAIGFALIAAALALFGYCSYVLVGWYGRRPTVTPRRASAREIESPVGERNAAALHAAALVAARGGRYRDAAGLLFIAAVRALDECGRVAYDPARTPGEYRRIVCDPLFDAFAADAVVALFAPAEPAGELFARMSDAYDRFFKAPPR